MRRLLEPHAAALIKRCVLLAKSGDPTAMRLCIDRLVAPVREQSMQVRLPKIQSAEDCVQAQSTVIAAVAGGEMLPSEAQLLSSLIEAQRRAYETDDLVKRLAALEEKLQPSRSPSS